MAEGTLTAPPAYVTTLADALVRRLPGADVGYEHVRDRRFRFMVVTPAFQDMGHPDRQRIVWDQAAAALDRGDLRDVTMIITMSPDEVG